MLIRQSVNPSIRLIDTTIISQPTTHTLLPRTTHTPTELYALITPRATALTDQASQSWIRQLGPPPTDLARRATWEQHVRTITTYRDR